MKEKEIIKDILKKYGERFEDSNDTIVLLKPPQTLGTIRGWVFLKENEIDIDIRDFLDIELERILDMIDDIIKSLKGKTTKTIRAELNASLILWDCLRLEVFWKQKEAKNKILKLLEERGYKDFVKIVKP